MKKPGEHTKGPTGHWLDLRKAMGSIAVTATEWCRAFDAGDMAALGNLNAIMAEQNQDACEAAKAACEAAPQLDDSNPNS